MVFNYFVFVEGAGGSGKSTLFKQMKVIYGDQYSELERRQHLPIIYRYGTVRHKKMVFLYVVVFSKIKLLFCCFHFSCIILFYFIPISLFLYFSLSLYTCICLYKCPHSRLLSPTIYLFHIIFLSLTLIASLSFFPALPSLSFYLSLLSVRTVLPSHSFP